MTNNDLPEFLNEFSNYLIGIKNLSRLYINSMKNTIKQFLNFINVHILKKKYKSIKNVTLNDMRSLTNSDIYSFMFYLAENHYKISSRIVKTEHLKTFFDYLYRIKHDLFREPFKQIKNEKKTFLQLPNYLSLQESKELLKVYSGASKINEVRDNAILHIILNCGLRISEVKNLKISDIDFNDNKFLIFGKGNKERYGYLNDITKNAILKYMNLRKNITPKSSKDNDILFLSSYKKRLSSFGIEKAIDKAYEKVGIDSKIYTVHSLRHTCATLLYKSGIDIKTIQEILGHVQIDTTEIYTHLHDEEVMNAMFIHPLSKFKISNAISFDNEVAA